MLFEYREKIGDMLIRLLSTKPGSSAAELHRALAKLSRPCSIQGVYKELRNLQAGGIVVKAGETYSLHLPWLSAMIRFSEQVGKAYFQESVVDISQIGEGQKRTWYFSDFRKMDDFWTQLMVELPKQARDKYMMQWIPHPWFILINPKKEALLMRALARLGTTLYGIIGGRTGLDRELERWWPKKVTEFSFSVSAFERMRTTYITQIGEYVLTITVPARVAAQMDDLYQKSDRAAEHAAELLRVLATPARLRAVLEHNSKKARQYRRTFVDFFGIKGAQQDS